MSDPRNPEAFPRTSVFTPQGHFSEGQKGMTLGDWFAGQAPGSYSNYIEQPGLMKTVAFDPGPPTNFAYALADARLAERAKEN